MKFLHFITGCILFYLPTPNIAQTTQPVEIFQDFTFGTYTKIVRLEDIYFVLDGSNHRIILFDFEQRAIGNIGRSGQEPGAFHWPIDIAVDQIGSLYVLDSGNKRIQWFDKNGQYQGFLPLNSTVRGFAVNSKDEIFLGQPHEGKLISVYNKKGDILRQFGEPITASTAYGEEYTDYDDWYNIAINRIEMDIDEQENIYVAFYHAPIIRKYTSSGELVYEKRIDGIKAHFHIILTVSS